MSIGSAIDGIPLIGIQTTLHSAFIDLQIDHEHTLLLDDDIVLLVEIVDQSHGIIDNFESEESEIEGEKF